MTWFCRNCVIILQGWSANRLDIPECVRPYFASREDELVFKRDLLVVPISIKLTLELRGAFRVCVTRSSGHAWQQRFDGLIEPYHGNRDLEAYLERLELYFIANNVGAISGDDNEVAMRLADRKKKCNSANAGRVRDIPFVKPFTQSTIAIRIYVWWNNDKADKPDETAAINNGRAFSISQKIQTTEKIYITRFAAELRRLASTCTFGDFLTEDLRDQFVCGIKHGNTQRKLLDEDRSFEHKRDPCYTCIFKEEKANVKIAISMFADLSPLNLLLNSQTPSNVCLSTYHQNFIMAVKAVRNYLPGIPSYINDIQYIV